MTASPTRAIVLLPNTLTAINMAMLDKGAGIPSTVDFIGLQDIQLINA